MGRHFAAKSMIFVSDLLDHPAKIELNAAAVLPNDKPETTGAEPAKDSLHQAPL
jgi:hypothetical protein